MPAKKTEPPIDMGEIIDDSVDLDLLTAPFPPAAIKQRVVGGGRSLSYVEGHTVIHRLNAATGNSWSMEVLDITDMQIGQMSVLRAHVRLTIPGLGSREHVGVQSIADRAGEDLVKGAITDALKKASTLFGVGLELYGPDYGSGELDHAPAAKAAPAAAPAKAKPDQLSVILDAGKMKGLNERAVRDIAIALTSSEDIGGLHRDKAMELWTFITKESADRLEGARVAGESERNGY